jgi:hypothetical protein
MALFMFAGWLGFLLRTMHHHRYGYLQRYNKPTFHDVYAYLALTRDDVENWSVKLYAVAPRQLARIWRGRRLHLNSGMTSATIIAGFGRASRHVRQYQSKC